MTWQTDEVTCALCDDECQAWETQWTFVSYLGRRAPVCLDCLEHDDDF